MPSNKTFSSSTSPSQCRDEVEVGDYVDFESYGKCYVVDVDYMMSNGITWWVTGRKEERFNPKACGWSIPSVMAVSILEKGDKNEV